jgi:hypothetical protein
MAFLMRTARSIGCQNAISDLRRDSQTFFSQRFLSVESLHHLEITDLSRPHAPHVLQLLATVCGGDTGAALARSLSLCVCVCVFFLCVFKPLQMRVCGMGGACMRGKGGMRENIAPTNPGAASPHSRIGTAWDRQPLIALLCRTQVQ